MVSGSMAPAIFQNFGMVEVASGASFTDTGAVTVASGQTVEALGSLTLGGVTGVISNGGILEAGGGTLTLAGAVGGKGVAIIAGGVFDCAGAFNQAVSFTGTTGVLQLAQSQTYTAIVSGFSKSGATSLDLLDIAFLSSGEATFSGTKTGGSLTVTDGTHTAHINLKGNYTASTWIATSDGHGGTSVIDPGKSKTVAAPIESFIAVPRVHGLIAAMSTFAPLRSDYSHIAPAPGAAAAIRLVAPKVDTA